MSPAAGGDNEVAGLELVHVGANRFDLPETFMPDHEKFVTVESGAILGGTDFLVGAIDANLQDADQYALAGEYCDGFPLG